MESIFSRRSGTRPRHSLTPHKKAAVRRSLATCRGGVQARHGPRPSCSPRQERPSPDADVSADWDDNTAASVLLGNGTTTTTSHGLQPNTGVSLATQADALSAQGQIDDYLESVNKIAGTIGTALSRFQIAAHVASSVADVSQAAEARITDADMAENSAALVRNQILQQAASAILAQANQQPALALTLLHE